MFGNLLKSVLGNAAAPQPGPTQPSSGDRVTVFTTVHAQGFAQYGRQFMDSFLRYWPKSYDLVIYAEGFDIPSPSSRVRIVDNASVQGLADFKLRHAQTPMAHGRNKNQDYSYRFDAVRFANKVFAMCDIARLHPSRYVLWLDCDTATFQGVPADFVSRLLGSGEFMAYLGRTGMHSETGFLPFDLDHPGAQAFFSTLERFYASDAVFSLSEWHDCQVIDATRGVLQAQGALKARNLNAYGASHPFINSIPGLFMDHLKGPVRKDQQHSSGADFLVPPYTRVNLHGGRYSQLPVLLDEILPSDIVEVGTWSGWRAVQMALVSLRQGIPVHYRGFDVFEDFTPEFDQREMNVKPHFSKAEVTRLLQLVRDLYPSFSFELIQGDTNDTLRDLKADFAFIDGGHSVETIAHDFGALKSSAYVLLDDFYTGPIDTTRFGCNQALQGHPFMVLPKKDPVAGGGGTQFALFAADGNLAELGDLLRA